MTQLWSSRRLPRCIYTFETIQISHYTASSPLNSFFKEGEWLLRTLSHSLYPIDEQTKITLTGKGEGICRTELDQRAHQVEEHRPMRGTTTAAAGKLLLPCFLTLLNHNFQFESHRITPDELFYSTFLTDIS